MVSNYLQIGDNVMVIRKDIFGFYPAYIGFVGEIHYIDPKRHSTTKKYFVKFSLGLPLVGGWFLPEELELING